MGKHEAKQKVAMSGCVGATWSGLSMLGSGWALAVSSASTASLFPLTAALYNGV